MSVKLEHNLKSLAVLTDGRVCNAVWGWRTDFSNDLFVTLALLARVAGDEKLREELADLVRRAHGEEAKVGSIVGVDVTFLDRNERPAGTAEIGALVEQIRMAVPTWADAVEITPKRRGG